MAARFAHSAACLPLAELHSFFAAKNKYSAADLGDSKIGNHSVFIIVF